MEIVQNFFSSNRVPMQNFPQAREIKKFQEKHIPRWPTQLILRSCIYVHISKQDAKRALGFALNTSENDAIQATRSLQTMFTRDPTTDRVIVGLSVRSIWDNFLRNLKLPRGSEVLMTAINIPNMVQIVRFNNLIPVPVDIDFNALAPSLEDVEKAITPRTKVFMISYIFGVRYDITKIVELCNSKGIMVVEDIAEDYRGPKESGHPGSALSLFSFGTIKIDTAFGCAIGVVRNCHQIYEKMQQDQRSYSKLKNSFFLKKVMKGLLAAGFLNSRQFNYGIRMYGFLFNFDYKEFVVSLVRGFKVDPTKFLKTFQLRPCDAQICFLEYRIRNFDPQIHRASVAMQTHAQQQLIEAGVEIPGSSVPNRNFWLYPFMIDEREFSYKAFNMRGVDIYKGATQLRLIEPPAGFGYTEPKQSGALMKKVMYFPIHRYVTRQDVQKMVEATKKVVGLSKELKQLRSRL